MSSNLDQVASYLMKESRGRANGEGNMYMFGEVNKLERNIPYLERQMKREKR